MGSKTKIETFDSTWNPVSGCLHGCRYCYASSIAIRFAGSKAYPAGFAPTFHEDELSRPSKWKKGRRIFVCSMADLFGNWVPDEWIGRVIDACKAAPQHTYFFLTKNPGRYEELKLKGIIPDLPNFWYGSSVTKKNDRFVYFERFGNWYLSIEPLLEDLGSFCSPVLPAWVVIGAETGVRTDKVTPRKEWIDNITAQLPGVPVYMKPSLLPVMGEENMRREFPG